MARKEYEYEIVWVGQPNNVRNNTWKGRAEHSDMGYAQTGRVCSSIRNLRRMGWII